MTPPTIDTVIENALAQFDQVVADAERKSLSDLLPALEAAGQVVDVDALDNILARFRRDTAEQRARLPDVIRAAYEKRP